METNINVGKEIMNAHLGLSFAGLNGGANVETALHDLHSRLSRTASIRV